MRAPSLILSLILLLVTSAAQAQVGRSVELPAHRALFAVLQDQPDLAPFTTDGCSGGMSEMWSWMAQQFPEFAQAHDDLPPWQGCCITHDRAYHNAGGTSTPEASFDARLVADEELRACVQATAQTRGAELTRLYGLGPDQVAMAYDAIAAAMFRAVRLGGGPCSGLPWRWGYGFAQCSPLDGLGE